MTTENLCEVQRKLRILETMPGFGWSANVAGHFTYVTPNTLSFLGVAGEDLNASDADDEFGWRQVIHPDDYERVAARWRHCLQTGDHYDTEHRLRRADGSYRWFRNSGRPCRDEQGTITEWFGTTIDIDDQVRLCSEIAEREARIRRLVDSDIIGIVIWDLNGTLIDANDAFLRMVQYDREDVKAGLRWFDMTPPEWQEVHGREEVEELVATGKMEPREKAFFRKDGSRVPVLIGAACFDGQPRQGVAYILDLTERKRAEEALHDQKRELSQLVDMIPSYLWRVTPQGVPEFFNKRLVDFLGLDVAGVNKPGSNRLTAFIEAIIHPDDAVGVADAFERSLASGDALSMKWRMRRADGVYRWMAASAEPMRDADGRIVNWYGLCHDIEDQLQAEEALRSSKQQLEQMIDAVPVNILSFDPSGMMTYASKRYVDEVGPPPLHIEDFDALAVDAAHPDDFPAMFRRASDGFATGCAFVNRFRRREKDGDYRWIEARAQPLRASDGTIVQWYVASIDIQDEMRAQEALRERERMLHHLVETLPAMIDCATPDGEPIYRSQQMSEYLGFDFEHLDSSAKSRLNGTLEASVHPDDLAGVKANYGHSLATGEPYARRHRLRRSNGEYRWVETRAAPMRDTRGAIVQWNVICLDIDPEVRAQQDLQLAQERLARASQAASLAELSASIAHEVNQPLAAIVANSHACHRWLSTQPANIERAKVTAERIIRNANAAADIVSRIRALFSQSTETRTIHSLDGVIAETRELLADEAARRHVCVDLDIASNIPTLAFDRVQIQQVLINLMRNGMEAMDAVATHRVLRLRVRRVDDVVRTGVSDSGPGIELPNRMFEPFYTTKPHGMGIGLAICRSIVEAHGGQLWAENNEPNGATFTFSLPIGEAPATRQASAAADR
jgi:PAS domain S-box-containing protein